MASALDAEILHGKLPKSSYRVGYHWIILVAGYLPNNELFTGYIIVLIYISTN